MSYQVLARKWRPRDFEQMVGQAHVRRALANALVQGRLHHAYLFSGTRGVGKTTVARILAKCLNCEQGVTATPCGVCSACREIDEGRFVDLIEVDAASRTKVEDTRELLDNVQYAPTRGRYKVYLIDEVHMLSGHSFNALLKTLEEPPPHVKFLLATTDPQKLPVTILSRCLQFNLKRLPTQAIAQHLRYVLEQEGIAADEAALAELARCAEGSMRDALSLLDQAVAFGNGEVHAADVSQMLDSVSGEHLQALIAALGQRSAGQTMDAVAKLAEHAVDFDEVLAELLSLLHQAAVVQQVPEVADTDNEGFQWASLLAQSLSPEDIQLHYQIALIGRRDLPLAPDPRAGFEMVLLRMLSFAPLSPAGVTAPSTTETGAASPSASATPTVQVDEQAPAVHPRIPPCAELDWSALVNQLGLTGVTYALASNCSLRSRQPGEVVLVLGMQHAEIRTKNAEQRLQAVLRDYFSEDLVLKIEIAAHATATPAQTVERQQLERQRAAERTVENDPVVKGLKAHFGATVIHGSVEPLD